MDYRIYIDALDNKIDDFLWYFEFLLRKEDIFDKCHLIPNEFESDGSKNNIDADIFIVDKKGKEIFSAVEFKYKDYKIYIKKAVEAIKIDLIK